MNPGTWNKYAYVEGDPVNRLDRRGMLFESPGCAIDDPSCDPGLGDAGGCTFDPGNDFVEACNDQDQAPAPQQVKQSAPPPTPDCQQQLIAVIDGYTAGSPMGGLGAIFVADGQQFNVDPRFVVALAVAESGLGRNQGNACNDFGYFYNGYGRCSPFDSYSSEISSVTKNIRARHLNPPYNETTAQQVYSGGGVYAYCHGNCTNGLNNLTKALNAMGGNTNSLVFPCNPDGTWKNH